ncbi:HK97 family phage prohead protease [Sinorhizobium meliloti]|uniref:HK97 family phage prohead protease n=1 Tax=Rhizobium meliloti TaxID=382 RepID=UPI00299E3904|nr:HK97 family phage prohead protease [Sinorhizobium meliloti]MDW9997094.1 HK97 family phage prohead protease [Sinorhizobium meliloti]
MDRLIFETKLAIEESGEISATAWLFDTPDRIGDVIEKGAFNFAKFPLPMLFGHDLNDPVGTWNEGTEDAKGFKVKGTLLIESVARAREVHSLVKAGAVKGVSIGFVSKKAVARAPRGRLISKLELMEISLVTIPMHPGARVTSAKSAIRAIAVAEAINRATAALKTKR